MAFGVPTDRTISGPGGPSPGCRGCWARNRCWRRFPRVVGVPRTGSPWCPGGTRRSAPEQPRRSVAGITACAVTGQDASETRNRSPSWIDDRAPRASSPAVACSPDHRPGWWTMLAALASQRIAAGPDHGCSTNAGGQRTGTQPVRALQLATEVEQPAGAVHLRRLEDRRGVRLMGWSNPVVPWSELERALSGRPPRPGRGPVGPLRPLGHDRPEPDPAPIESPHRSSTPARSGDSGRRWRPPSRWTTPPGCPTQNCTATPRSVSLTAPPPRNCWWRRRSGWAGCPRHHRS